MSAAEKCPDCGYDLAQEHGKVTETLSTLGIEPYAMSKIETLFCPYCGHTFQRRLPVLFRVR